MFHVEHHGDVVALELARHIRSIGLELSAKQRDLVSTYAEELGFWSQKINLTTISDPKGLAVKHFLDSLHGSSVLCRGDGANVLDIGAGAGFPGIPLKIINPDLELYLLEKNKKKASFLLCLIGKLKLTHVHVISKTAKELAQDQSLASTFMNIVVRAVNFSEIADEVAVLMHSVGRAIIYRTDPSSKDDVPEHLKVLETVRYELPMGYGRRSLVIMSHS